ncbi:hypothetical protein [Endozoicomonas sp. ONNA2]|uniref:hypothetical protein n=1 Tax=Endozoicomonas sp. ONNA2 TaxID=2828741 RepID=UPI0021472912|nr:hypothetical protein [Endozoicomonas sp. ONNA2]
MDSSRVASSSPQNAPLPPSDIPANKEDYKKRIKDLQEARTQKRKNRLKLMQRESKQVTETTAPSTIPVDMKNGASEPLKKSNNPAYTEDRQWESDIEAIFKT